MIPLGEPPDSLNDQQILDKYKGVLDKLIAAAADPTYDYERQLLLNEARSNLLYVKGHHFNIPGLVDTPYGQIADYIPFDPTSGSNQVGAEVKLCPPINFIGGDCYKYMAVMGQNSPRVKAVADDPNSSDDTEAARKADANVRDLWAKNKIDRKWRAVPFHQYSTGPAFIRGMWVRDGGKYGIDVEPKIEMVAGEDGSVFPQQVGAEQYENGDAEVFIYGALEVTILPYTAASLEEVHLLRFEVMRSKWDLLNAFGEALEQWRDGDIPDDQLNAASTTAAEAREATTQPSATGMAKRPNQWRWHEYWMKPFLFEAIAEQEVREVFKRHYPDGLYLAKVGNIPVAIGNAKLTDEWTVCRVGRSDRIMERPLCADGMPLQRAINDLGGMGLETILRGITQTWIDNTLMDREAFQTKEAVPGEYIPTALPVEGDLSKKMYTPTPARLSDQAIPFYQALRTAWQNISGITENLYGGGQPAPTYRQEKMRRDSAMAQLAPQADEMKFAAEDVARILVNLRSKYGVGMVKAPRDTGFGVETDIVDMAELSTAGVHFESDPSFPVSQADKFDKIFAILNEFKPEVQQALGVADPMNIDQVVEALGVPDFISVLEEQKRKTLLDVEQLLQAAPIEVPGPDGQPQLQPSLKIDDYDDHNFVALFLAAWMRDDAGRKVRVQNPQGFENVQLFWQAHKTAAQPPTPQEPPVRGNLNVSVKAEQIPGQMPAVFEAAGIPAGPEAANIIPEQPKPEVAPAPESPTPNPESQIEPLPPIDQPQGPQPPMVQ